MDENNQPGNQANSGDAETRIQELIGEIQGLKQSLDQKRVLENQERENLQAQQEQAQQNQGYDPNSDDVRVWGPWMAPKIAPFLAERDRVIIALADKVDELETMRKFPEYGDEEYQSKVTKFIRETKKNRGFVLSRTDAITHLKGQEVLSGKSQNANEQDSQQQGQPQANQGYRQVSSAVESRGGIGSTRAATQTSNKNPEDMDIDEFESQFRDMKV